MALDQLRAELSPFYGRKEPLPPIRGEVQGRALRVLAVPHGASARGRVGYLNTVIVLCRIRRLAVGAYNLRCHVASSLLLRSAPRISSALASGDSAADRSWSKAFV
jgi:hypothetical protein